jgi:hypothetical protein
MTDGSVLDPTSTAAGSLMVEIAIHGVFAEQGIVVR